MKFAKPLNQVEVKQGSTGDGENRPMPIGAYTAIIDNAEETTSKNGNEMVVLTLKLAGNPKYDNKLVWHRMTNWGDGEMFLDQVASLLECANQERAIDELDFTSLTGLAVKFQNKHEEYNGEEKDAVHFFVPIDPVEQMQLMAQSGTVRPLNDVEDDSSIPF